MSNTPTRRLVIVVLVLALIALVRLWPESGPEDGERSQDRATSATESAPTSEPGGRDDANPATGATDSAASAEAHRSTPSATEMSPQVDARAMRLQVLAPADAEVGQVSEVRIQLEANRGVREIMFDVAFEKSRLSLVGWHDGDLMQQGTLPVEFVVQEPSDGNVHVSVKVRNGLLLIGTGSVAVLEIAAIKPGNSSIVLQNISAVDASGATDSAVAVVQDGAITIH